MIKTDKKTSKLTLTTVTVKKLRDHLSDQQLRDVVGGATCDESNTSRTAVAC